MKLFLKNRENKFEFMIYVYFGLMLLLYFGFIFLDNQRLNKSDLWLSKSLLTEVDVENISRLGMWASSFEFTFLALFIITMSIIIFRYRKNIKILNCFLIVNTILFIGIMALSYIIFLITSLPIGNLLQPLFAPVYFLGGLFIYLLWISKKRLIK
ncbi:hypothetical protein J2Z40_000420 [Cytobacillus eiseniae]|uniref:Uncharacterized protein n=1 Tax=Cytobacillus eiseniae TaxID=762947 RepID=A0ABS4RDE6_9BACI|nr:hypothetical protein [Cytobacillus eiseniae]MBP2239867.1 hypothetical protein [Cytobacillus eiseniae]